MKLHMNSEAVKQIFDHFRNIGIAAVVLGAARWSYVDIWAKTWPIYVMASATTISLVVIGLWLFVLNVRHGLFLLGKQIDPDSRTAWTIRFLYGIFVFALVGALSGVDPKAKLSDLGEKNVVPSVQSGAK